MNTAPALLLLADSQLLFRPDLLPQVKAHIGPGPHTAAYIGAANGHQVEFFQLACNALDSLLGQPVTCDFIRTEQDLPVALPAIVILAGGSVSAGWEFLSRPWLAQWLAHIRMQANGLVIGVSAGAIHLAGGIDPEIAQPLTQRYLDWLPAFIAVHEEKSDWPSRLVWQRQHNGRDFYGLPFGGGLWVRGQPVQSVGKGYLHSVASAQLAATVPHQPGQ